MNWLIPPPTQEQPLRCTVQLRAREATRAASIHASVDGAEVLLDDDALPAPGQACVLYDGARVLGGGFVCR
jgi:tRNA-specific 2-thiouridylase